MHEVSVQWLETQDYDASLHKEAAAMRYSPDHKALTHQRIIKEAADLFRRDGIGATGLQPLMKSLGLTHGGFYAHFASKNELVEKALQQAACEVDGLCADIFNQPQPLHVFIDTYLSQWHVTSPHEGCPLPTMSAEMAQQGHAITRLIASVFYVLRREFFLLTRHFQRFGQAPMRPPSWRIS